MITTVTLNAAIDKTYEMPSLHTYEVNRADLVFAEPGGKGVNGAKVLHQLGTDVVASGIVGGFNGKQICGLLEHIGVQHDFISIRDESRLCLNIVEPSGKQTEILESGPNIDKEDWKGFKEKFQSLATKSEIVILSGSLPKGLPKDAYAELIRMAQPMTRVILDTSGEALGWGLKAKPFMIKPNKQEFAELTGTHVSDVMGIIDILREWQPNDISVVIVTLGSRGALASIGGEIYKVRTPDISAVNPVGSGDAFTAGMAFGFQKGWNIKETLTIASSLGAANALEKKAGKIDLKNVERFKSQIHIENVTV